MLIIDYQKKYHIQTIKSCVKALKQGKTIAYPTDTSYGLAADATNLKAIKILYKIKERGFKQPIHVVVPSVAYAKKITAWNSVAVKLARKFWPGPLTLVLGLRAKRKGLRVLSAGTGFIGLRCPKNNIALDLAKYFKRSITATSANPSAHISGGFDSFSASDVIKQFENKKCQPDIIINAGRLPKHKPSTLVKIDGNQITILRQGPVSEKQIRIALKAKR
ncbi:MAG: L-threonylcarbamoyladenylate synthase [Patescibacteria group bacterium]|nr:L-threonylcarbamoyladenylate synthase [Patescibacteria group bacterium]